MVTQLSNAANSRPLLTSVLPLSRPEGRVSFVDALTLGSQR
jgi:hypothetical protein